MTVRSYAFASPDYIKKQGSPAKPEDLDHHHLIIYGEDQPPPTHATNWLIDAGTKPGTDRKAILKVNNIHGIYRAVQSGLGIGAIPNYMLPEASELVRVLPELSGPTIEAYFVYPEELRPSKRIAVFRDFLIKKVVEAKLN
jgi:DNA-binding transcriptional LysR family regulator